MTVAEAIANNSGTGTVEGYIVWTCYRFIIGKLSSSILQ